MQAWHSWMSCVTSGVCRLIIGGLLTSTVYLCNCIWKLSEAFILWPFCEWFSQAYDFITRVIFMTAVMYCIWHMSCWILCMRCTQYILFFMFCGLEQHSGYGDLLYASLGCGIYHPPLSSAEVKESIEVYPYSPCRPWMPVVGWNLFFTFF